MLFWLAFSITGIIQSYNAVIPNLFESGKHRLKNVMLVSPILKFLKIKIVVPE